VLGGRSTIATFRATSTNTGPIQVKEGSSNGGGVATRIYALQLDLYTWGR